MLRGVLATAVALGALVAAAPVSAAQVTTFDGTCSFTAVPVTHTPPMTSTLQPTHIDIAGDTGTCTGTVERDGRTYSVDGAQTSVQQAGDGVTSCQASNTSGTGWLLIADRWKVRFDYEEPRVGPVGDLTYHGKAGGYASNTAHLNADEDLADIFARCGAGGVRTVHVDGFIVAHGLAG
jgi:hypothetical protein